LFFSIPHSLLLQTKVKKSLHSHIPRELYPTVYSLHATVSLSLMYLFWKDSSVNFISFKNDGVIYFIKALYISSWFFMFWSMLATGLFKQNGVDSWWAKIRGKKYQYKMPTQGPYQLTRHPIYVGFLGMIWFTPNYSIDRLLISLFWTGYILIGMYLKEKRLLRNKSYRDYSKKVSIFPLIPKKLDYYLKELIWSVS